MFAVVRESQLSQFQEFYRKLCIVETELSKIPSDISIEEMIKKAEMIVLSFSQALQLLDNPPSHGLFPEYEPSLLFSDPVPPSNCIIEIYLKHREFVIKTYGLQITPNNINAMSPPPQSQSTDTPRSSLSMTRPLIKPKSKPVMSFLRSKSVGEEEEVTNVEWGSGEGMMGYPKGSKQVTVQGKFHSVSYLFEGYNVVVMAKREVHIIDPEVDEMYNEINMLLMEWTNVLHNLRQLKSLY